MFNFILYWNHNWIKGLIMNIYLVSSNIQYFYAYIFYSYIYEIISGLLSLLFGSHFSEKKKACDKGHKLNKWTSNVPTAVFLLWKENQGLGFPAPSCCLYKLIHNVFLALVYCSVSPSTVRLGLNDRPLLLN